MREGASFFDFARRYSKDSATAVACGYVGKVTTDSLPPQVQQLIIGARQGDLLGPVKVGKDFEVLLLEKIHPAQFDGETRQKLEDELFKQWLNDERARAHIEFDF